MKRISAMAASALLLSGLAMADADGDLSNPSTTGTGAMEEPASSIGVEKRDATDSREEAPRDDSALGTMGTGATGTTGGTGATTGTDSIQDSDEAEQ
ncbi:hypothetical protein MST27_14270 [Pseudomonas sp. PS1]|uniref:Uncharacterized protein n=1 Tax=Stutzerimonas marianensis TaxID=2929513 RepID=A0A9X1W5C4_9GAMM|nr:hypothetical protein [Pseudomonas marianensis]MCJ0974535.1 hypothetical protein [Pseudomonas marianensis]